MTGRPLDGAGAQQRLIRARADTWLRLLEAVGLLHEDFAREHRSTLRKLLEGSSKVSKKLTEQLTEQIREIEQVEREEYHQEHLSEPEQARLARRTLFKRCTAYDASLYEANSDRCSSCVAKGSPYDQRWDVIMLRAGVDDEPE